MAASSEDGLDWRGGKMVTAMSSMGREVTRGGVGWLGEDDGPWKGPIDWAAGPW